MTRVRARCDASILVRPLTLSRMLMTISVVLTMALAGLAKAEPFRPANPQQVLLRVAPEALSDLLNCHRPRKASSIEQALDTATDCIAQGRRADQPGGFGRAEAMLKAWRLQGAHSARWHVLSADIHQYRHEYPAALTLLDRAVTLDARDVRAYLMRAAINQTRGELAASRKDCSALLALGETALGTACLAQVIGMTGQLERARDLLRQLLDGPSGESAAAPIRIWMLEGLADMDDRSGDLAAAEKHLLQSLSLDGNRPLARLSLADLLLVSGRGQEALEVLRPLAPTQAVLIRRAEAAPSLHSRELFKRALDEAQLRGEKPDLRDVARLHTLAGERCAAARAARDNWQMQRETTDVRLLASTGCYDAGALAALQQWIDTTGYQDVRLRMPVAATTEARS